MKLPEKSKAVQILEQFCYAYNGRNITALLKLFTKDCNVWGTGIDEYRVGLKALEEQMQRDWSQSDKAEVHIVSLVPSSKDATWAAGVCKALVTIEGKEHVFNDFRGTIVIHKENGDWKISHMHTSFPDYRHGAGESFPAETA